MERTYFILVLICKIILFYFILFYFFFFFYNKLDNKPIILVLDAAKVKSDLPHLEDYKKNVLEWIEDLKEYLILYDITKPRKVFTWVLAAVEVNVKMLSMLLLLEETVKNATQNLVKYERL